MPQIAWPPLPGAGSAVPDRRSAAGRYRVGSSADGLPVALPPLPAAPLLRGARPGPRGAGAAERGARASGSATPTCSAAPGARARPRPPASSPRPSTAPTCTTASPAACATRAWPSRRGTSYDLQELDAASNNGVDAMRDLIGKAALGSPGRTKVYILDEVHMLSTAASNALLKTLEEPPTHVVFVLATTDPQKVLPTIRSRTQHFEFHLLPADELAEHVQLGHPRRRPRCRRRGRRLRGAGRRRLRPRHPVGARPGRGRRGARRRDARRRAGRRPVRRRHGPGADRRRAGLDAGRSPRVLGEELLPACATSSSSAWADPAARPGPRRGGGRAAHRPVHPGARGRGRRLRGIQELPTSASPSRWRSSASPGPRPTRRSPPCSTASTAWSTAWLPGPAPR